MLTFLQLTQNFYSFLIKNSKNERENNNNVILFYQISNPLQTEHFQPSYYHLIFSLLHLKSLRDAFYKINLNINYALTLKERLIVLNLILLSDLFGLPLITITPS